MPESVQLGSMGWFGPLAAWHIGRVDGRHDAGVNVREGRLARVRLVERLASASVAVVEAGSGYGKSTLAADVRAAVDEVGAVCRDRFAVALAPVEVRALHQATGGWAAAVVLAGPRLAQAADPGVEVAILAAQPTVFGFLVERILERLGPSRSAACVRLAHLPLLSPEIAAMTGTGEACDPDDLFARALDAGLPFTATRDGWWELPGPVVDLVGARRDARSRGGPPSGRPLPAQR